MAIKMDLMSSLVFINQITMAFKLSDFDQVNSHLVREVAKYLQIMCNLLHFTSCTIYYIWCSMYTILIVW